jgi:hypothetical protein
VLIFHLNGSLTGWLVFMREKRKQARARVFLGGVIAFNKRRPTLQCCVRNMSPAGAFIALESTAVIPDEFDLSIPCREKSLRARLIWRNAEAAGLSFTNLAGSNVVPLDYAVKLKVCERENARLTQRLADLRSAD